MDNETLVKVINRSSSTVSYSLPELHISRYFNLREEKEIPFVELKALFASYGGSILIKENLLIKDKEAIDALGFEIEPEYLYNEDDVKRVMVNGTYDEFLDMLDFAPDGVIDLIKKLSVDLPLNDVSKRDAILEKIGFNVTRAIEIKNTAFDSGEQDSEEKKVRRVATTTPTATPIVRRTSKE